MSSKMSSIKRRRIDDNVNEESNKETIDCPQNERQLFDRLDDQLVERLLYYLPLKDKILLIGMNKRFKKCLSESQKDLVIDYKIGNQFNSLSKLEEINNKYLEESEDIEDIDDDEEEDKDSDFFLKINKRALNWILKTFKS